MRSWIIAVLCLATVSCFAQKGRLGRLPGWVEVVTNEQDATAMSAISGLSAIVTNKPTRLFSPDAKMFIDGTGGVWRINQIVTTNVTCTLSAPFGIIVAPDMYNRPEQSVYIGPINTSVDCGNDWSVNFDQNKEGLWYVVNTYEGAYWSASGYELPLVAEGGGGNLLGTAVFDYAFVYSAETTRVDGVVFDSMLPKPGCEDLGSGNTLTIYGPRTSYIAAPANNYSLEVSETAPRWTYAIRILSSKTCTLGNGLVLQGSWTVTGTNIVTLKPGEGTSWEVYARGLK